MNTATAPAPTAPVFRTAPPLVMTPVDPADIAATTGNQPVAAHVQDGMLWIGLPMAKTPKQSKSGDSFVIASTGGNKPIAFEVGGKQVVVGVNAYYSAK